MSMNCGIISRVFCPAETHADTVKCLLMTADSRVAACKTAIFRSFVVPLGKGTFVA